MLLNGYPYRAGGGVAGLMAQAGRRRLFEASRLCHLRQATFNIYLPGRKLSLASRPATYLGIHISPVVPRSRSVPDGPVLFWVAAGPRSPCPGSGIAAWQPTLSGGFFVTTSITAQQLQVIQSSASGKGSKCGDSHRRQPCPGSSLTQTEMERFMKPATELLRACCSPLVEPGATIPARRQN
jgi:hypothetical protein